MGGEVRSATCGSRKGKDRLYFSNLKNKTGALRARGYFPKTRELVRFFIPHSAFPSTYLDMTRNKDGSWENGNST